MVAIEEHENLSRRNFLRLTAAALAAVTALPALPVFAEDRLGFDPAKEYGFAIAWLTADAGAARFDLEREVRDRLIEQARAQLPPGTVFEIRRQMPLDFGRTRGMAWYYSPGLPREPLFLSSAKDAEFDILNGVYLVARLRA